MSIENIYYDYIYRGAIVCDRVCIEQSNKKENAKKRPCQDIE